MGILGGKWASWGTPPEDQRIEPENDGLNGSDDFPTSRGENSQVPAVHLPGLVDPIKMFGKIQRPMDFSRDLLHQQFQWAIFFNGRLSLHKGRSHKLTNHFKPPGDFEEPLSNELSFRKPFKKQFQILHSLIPTYTYTPKSQMFENSNAPHPPPQKKRHPKFSDQTCFFWKPCNLAIPHVDQLTAWPLPLAW